MAVVATRRVVVRTTEAPLVTEQVVARPVGVRKGYLLRTDDDQWSWEDLRDYVADKIVDLSGHQIARNAVRAKAIFSSFCERWKEFAVPIARYAFEGPDRGWWKGAIIGFERFCKGSDPYFAGEIADLLMAAAQE
jgi:hypothetical protein